MCEDIENREDSKSPGIRDQYKLANEMHKEEANRYWIRNNVFLILNAALVAIFSKDITKQISIVCIVSSVGIIMALTWLSVLTRGKNQIERWRKVIDHYESKFSDNLKVYALADKYSKEIPAPRGLASLMDMSASKAMNFLVYSMSIIWVLLLVFSLLCLFGIFQVAEPSCG